MSDLYAHSQGYVPPAPNAGSVATYQPAPRIKHPIRTSDLAALLGCSAPYASQILTGVKKLSLSRAIEIFDKTGHQLGPIAGAPAEDIAILRKYARAA